MAELVQAAVILNASAGGGCNKEFAETLAAKFQSQGMGIRVTLAATGEELIEAARRAVAQGVKIIVAGGGDGTLNAVASALLGSDAIFGILPLGTLNHFAKDLGIPLDLDDAIATIAQGHSIRVDTGEINGRIFLNNSSLGLYPDTVKSREHQQRQLGRSKWVAFFWAAIGALRRYPFLDLTIDVNEQAYQRRTPFVFIGNNRYLMEGFNIGARERLDEGTLSLYVVQRTGRLGLLALALRALFGRLRQARDFDMLCAKEIVIATRHQHIRVATDGEVNRMDSPLRYRICPAALKVFVPKAGPAKE